LDSYDDKNYRLDVANGSRFVLKVLHAECPENVVALQHAAMVALRAARIAAPYPVDTSKGTHWVVVELGPHRHIARLLEWVPGRDYQAVAPADRPQLAYMFGELVAQVDRAFEALNPIPEAAFRKWLWRTSDAHLVTEFRDSVVRRHSAARVAIWDETMRLWNTQWAAQAATLPQGLVHNDINDRNVLVSEEGVPLKITGVLDLGDACVERYALSLGNSLFYAMLGLPLERVMDVAHQVTRGYCAAKPLSREELCMAAVGARMRCLVSATMAGATREKYPDNEYVGETEKPGWTLLEFLSTKGEDYLNQSKQ
jgi:Ser/Thr protein kinase RdoA (MazF antagonist)